MNEAQPTLLVSVIIVCYNCRQWLPRCFETLRQQTIYAQIELIIVDNASADGTEAAARELLADWPNATIIQTGQNLGFSANNCGVEVARGKYVYLYNPDTWLEPDCLEQFCLAVEREQAEAAGGRILEYEDNTLQAKGSTGFDIFGNPVSLSGSQDPNPLFCIAGFYFIRRDFFQRIGSLDEKFFMYGEEMDLSWRIWIAGGRVIYADRAHCHHRGAAATNPAGGTKAVENRTSAFKRFLANRNFLLVIAKNGQHLLLLLLVPCLLLMLAEAVATWILARSFAAAKKSCLDPIAAAWGLRAHIRAQRVRIAQIRKRSDLQMLKFLRLGFGRRHEFEAILKRGFPRFNR
jgi:GT2 family glycosyltransferase